MLKKKVLCCLMAGALSVAAVPAAYADEEPSSGIESSEISSQPLISVEREGAETTYYDTLYDAFCAFADGDRVALLHDYLIPAGENTTGGYEFKTPCNITFDFNDCAIYADKNSYDPSPGLGFGPGSTVLNINMQAYNDQSDIHMMLDPSDQSTWVCENEAYIFFDLDREQDDPEAHALPDIEIYGAKITGNITQRADDSGERVVLDNLRAYSAEPVGTQSYGFAFENSSICLLMPSGTNTLVSSGEYMLVMNLASDTGTTKGLVIEGGTFTGGPKNEETGNPMASALNNTGVWGEEDDEEGEEDEEEAGEQRCDVHIYGGTFESSLLLQSEGEAAQAAERSATVYAGTFKNDPTQDGAALAEGRTVQSIMGQDGAQWFVVGDPASQQPSEAAEGGESGDNGGSEDTQLAQGGEDEGAGEGEDTSPDGSSQEQLPGGNADASGGGSWSGQPGTGEGDPSAGISSGSSGNLSGVNSGISSMGVTASEDSVQTSTGVCGCLASGELDALRQEIAALSGQVASSNALIVALQDRDAVLSAKNASKTVTLKASAKKTVKKKSVKLTVAPSASGAEAVFSKLSGKRVSVSKTGKVTLKAGTKRGTYTAKVELSIGTSTKILTVRFRIR